MNKKKLVTYFSIILFSCMLGCSDKGIFENKPNLSDYPAPTKYEFSALDFPSANGSSWTYIETGSGVEYTVKVEGVRNINGETCRRLNYQLVGSPTDFLSANGFYIRLDGEYIGLTYPIGAIYIKKSLDYYTELAFEACLPTSGDPCIDAKDSEGNSVQHQTIKQEDFPPRKLWKFPIQVGSEWVVFKKPTPETITVVRNVAKITSVTVPKGSYPNAYLVEERLYFGETQDKTKAPDALYWLVPGVGVVKYQYHIYMNQSPAQAQIRTFELKEWQKG